MGGLWPVTWGREVYVTTVLALCRGAPPHSLLLRSDRAEPPGVGGAPRQGVAVTLGARTAKMLREHEREKK